VIVLTPELAGAMLDIYARRLNHPAGTRYTYSLLDAALGKYSPPLPPPTRREFAMSLKRPTWKHDTGSRS
jgi:hypothetical protein